MKKVLITASSFAHIYHFHVPYIEEFHKRGWYVCVACGGEIKQIPYADSLVQLPIKKSFFALSNFKSSFVLHKIIKKEKFDLVISHTTLAAFFTRISEILLKNRPKTINVVHGYLFDEHTPLIKATILRCAEYITAPLTDKILTMNNWDYKWAIEHKVGKSIGFIPGMGVDENKLLNTAKPMDIGVSSSDFVLIYPAEFSKRKNQEFLIRSLVKLDSNVKLILPGQGEYLEYCKSLAKKLNISDRVVFPGYISNIAEVFLSANVAVTSSRSEGLPFNIIEAMLCSLPIIASKVKGHADLIDEGVTGFLFDFDSEEAFITCVNTLMESKELCKRMGSSGKNKAEAYTLKNVFANVFDEYMS